jgi:hypothetical protein
MALFFCERARIMALTTRIGGNDPGKPQAWSPLPSQIRRVLVCIARAREAAPGTAPWGSVQVNGRAKSLSIQCTLVYHRTHTPNPGHVVLLNHSDTRYRILVLYTARKSEARAIPLSSRARKGGTVCATHDPTSTVRC